MGRKRWWQGGLELLMLCVLFHAVLGDGEVGCRFSKNLCKSGTEICYDDLAFGKCVQLYSNADDEDLYQYNLDPEELELLRLQLERLEIDGYRWPHPYTQCIMQNSLYALRFRSNHDNPELCRRPKEHDGHRQFRDNNEIDGTNSQPIAIVKFTPSAEDPHGDFADELYYPPKIPESLIKLPPEGEEYSYSPYTEESKKSNRHRSYQVRNRESPYDKLNALSNEKSLYKGGRKLHKKSSILNSINEDLRQLQRHPHRPNVRRNYIDFIQEILKDDPSTTDLGMNNEYLEESLPRSDLELLPNGMMQSNANFRERQGFNNIDPDDDYEKILEKRHELPKSFSQIEFLNQDSNRNINLRSFDGEDNNDVNRKGIVDLELIDKPIINTSSRQNGIYTQGGSIRPFRRSAARSERPTNIMFDNDLNALLLRRELAGFKRRERLDVKKPGPPFATNNYAFKTQSPPVLLEDDDVKDNREDEIIRAPLVKKELNGNGNKLDVPDKSYKNVDMDHVYVEFKQGINEWVKGEHIVKEVGRLLGLNSNALGDVRVGRAEVTFKVKDNDRKFNATDVANGIENLNRWLIQKLQKQSNRFESTPYKIAPSIIADIREKLHDSLGVEVVRAGIGDKAKLPATLEVTSTNGMSSGLFGALVAAGAAATGAAAVVTLIIARRHAKSRSKLAGLSTPDPEASKDYQDLCRARMQAKQPNEKPDSPRIVSLSRESESNNSPSSRSSTSSWSEEPALSNMDISTGHMVLSYMEDHLKNKDRLDQEWTALCAYEAEPSSTAIAERKENIERNRRDAALPYDHSRVVLNDLANINNSDYIDASTITDHDPRNPAYIATQGPLPQTGADFWQLVWEQGSVVIVMLTRLTEEGRAMCHRYWPEEGSELYHVYEVHLVSEHIWCDDYLVRSFYLKNLRTGETRTVTQFHFLSWPENGVPHSTKALLEFRRKVNKSYRGRSCPIVVHCSDGAGRTGTYTLIDMVLNRMAKGAKEIDIAATLEHIRDQRPGMVATKQQFEFVLMAVAEEVHAILKALPIPPVEKSPIPTTSNVSPPTKTDQ